MVKTACIVAEEENAEVCASHLHRVLTQSGYTIPTPSASVLDDRLYE